MNDQWLDFAMRIQSIAQAGLTYGKDPYDQERYEILRQIAAEMMAAKTDVSAERIYELFSSDSGYQTPKVDTRAAIFQEGKILLVRENNDKWSLPGGWCDVDESIASNTVKEVKEETGMTVEAERLIAVQDWRKHNVTNYVYGVVKTFMLCRYLYGEFQENIETNESAFFKKEEIPESLCVEKTTRDQIIMCFDAYENPTQPTLFD